MHHKVKAQLYTCMLIASLFLVCYDCYKLFGRGGKSVEPKMLVYYNMWIAR